MSAACVIRCKMTMNLEELKQASSGAPQIRAPWSGAEAVPSSNSGSARAASEELLLPFSSYIVHQPPCRLPFP